VSASSLSDASVALIGAGNMGLAMLEGWAAQGLSAERVAIIEPNPSERLRALCAAHGFALSPEGGARDAVVLAVKPQQNHTVHKCQKLHKNHPANFFPSHLITIHFKNSYT